MTNKILDIVEDAFDDQVSAEGWLDFETPMANVTGKDHFLKQVKAEIEKLSLGDKVLIVTDKNTHTVDAATNDWDIVSCIKTFKNEKVLCLMLLDKNAVILKTQHP